jgi:hypothetical protein
MKYSKVQIDLWRTQERVSQELAKMSSQEMQDHFRQVLEDFEARTGAHLNVIHAPKRPRSRSGSSR